MLSFSRRRVLSHRCTLALVNREGSRASRQSCQTVGIVFEYVAYLHPRPVVAAIVREPISHPLPSTPETLALTPSAPPYNHRAG